MNIAKLLVLVLLISIACSGYIRCEGNSGEGHGYGGYYSRPYGYRSGHYGYSHSHSHSHYPYRSHYHGSHCEGYSS